MMMYWWVYPMITKDNGVIIVNALIQLSNFDQTDAIRFGKFQKSSKKSYLDTVVRLV